MQGTKLKHKKNPSGEKTTTETYHRFDAHLVNLFSYDILSDKYDYIVSDNMLSFHCELCVLISHLCFFCGCIMLIPK